MGELEQHAQQWVHALSLLLVHTEELLVKVLQIAILELANPVGKSIQTWNEGC